MVVLLRVRGISRDAMERTVCSETGDMHDPFEQGKVFIRAGEHVMDDFLYRKYRGLLGLLIPLARRDLMPKRCLIHDPAQGMEVQGLNHGFACRPFDDSG